MEKILLVLAAALLFFSSCSNPTVYYSVWKGNNAFVAGDYQSANTEYLGALDKGTHVDYISYNLANVYYALGEGEAALDEWKTASFTGDPELLFRTMYNKGVLEFERGRYEDAFSSFKKALEINSESRNAKINLEYSLRRMKASANAAEAASSGAEASKKNEIPDKIQRVLQFIKQKDASSWKASTEENIQTGVNDW